MNDGKKGNGPIQKAGVGTAVKNARQRSDADEPAVELSQLCQVNLVLTIQRIQEWPKNPKASDENARQGGTISKFDLTLRRTDEKTPLVIGHMLEAAGPSSQTRRSDQRVVAGQYSLIKNPGSKGPYRLVQTSKVLSDQTFGKRGLVNIHAGRYPVHLEGCICPGPYWEELGVTKQGNRSNVFPSVTSSSRDKLADIKNKISKYGEVKTQETYDGYGSYSDGYYRNVSVVILDIRPIFVYFALYYTVDDRAFERAAETWKRKVEASSEYEDQDVFLMIPVSTEAEFKAAWDKVLQMSKKPNHIVKEGRVFSHASKESSQDGREFRKDPANDGTTNKLELSLLPVLNWAKGGTLHLHSCNSGVVGTRGWAPAGLLATSQSITVIGQSGFAYFSSNPGTYMEIDGKTKDVYLMAFHRRRNTPLLSIGGGSSMPEITFKPQE
jgi:hypothetical protein